MTQLLADRFGDYRITPILFDIMTFDGVHYNPQGAWLGNVMIEKVSDDLMYQWVKPFLLGGNPILAPDRWQENVTEFLSVLDV